MRSELHTLRLFAIVFAAVWLLPAAPAQTRASDSSMNDQNTDALVRDVMRHEIESQLRDNSLWCHREQRQDAGKPTKTLEVCQTKDGDLERLLAVNGRELSPVELQAEDQRLQYIVSHPELLRARQKKEREDGEQERNLLKLFPEAFRFQCEHESENLVTLRFQSKPNFRPSTRASQAFRHMEGTLVIDARQERLVEINGRLTSEVKFAGGLFGHLDKDGTFLAREEDVGDGHWNLTFLSVQINGKALFFKTINILEKRTLLDYRPLPRGATLQQAADFLIRDIDIHAASSSGKGLVQPQ
jgi:hypothetical protein